MAKNKDNIYRLYQSQIRDKDTAVSSFIDDALAKTQSMFRYENLPETLPAEELETLLQTQGNTFVTQVDGKLYALSGAECGEPDVYGHPTQYTVTNVALNLSKTYTIETDGVLMRNDTNGNSLLPIIGKYAVLYTDGLISLNTASILTRITMLISASDDKTKASANEFLKKILDGEFSIIGENAFFKGVNMQTAPTTNSVYITQLIELVQYYKASMLNEIGLNANYNMKRERLNLGEVSMNIDVLLPYVDNMLSERRKAVEKINKKYGTEITVSLGSSWKLEHENFEKSLEDVDTVTDEEKETSGEEPTDKTQESDEKKDETDGAEEEPTDTDKDEPEQKEDGSEAPEDKSDKDTTEETDTPEDKSEDDQEEDEEKKKPKNVKK